MTRRLLASLLLVTTSCVIVIAAASDEQTAPADPAVERARREVRLLSELYQSSMTLITEHYVHDGNDLPAGSAFKALFQKMRDKGWHEVRLLDATSQPSNDENWPRAGFEQDAVKALLTGKTSYDRVIEEDNKRYLHAATPIPLLMEKCIMCHEQYRDIEDGQPIGALSFRLPILD
jgi:hypothetical protein